jgi:DivIVA domain-containing protein
MVRVTHLTIQQISPALAVGLAGWPMNALEGPLRLGLRDWADPPWPAARRPFQGWVILGAVEDRGFSNSAAEAGSSPAASGSEQGFGELRAYVPEDILNARFPGAVRGYDRAAVDAYTKRVNRVIAELRVSASPPAAVRHALEQAGQQVHGLLQSARETAEEITASARREAEESTARAKAEAVDLVVNASAEADRAGDEAAQLIADARADAEAVVAKAKAEADEIRASAAAEAENITARSRAEADERLQQLEERLALLQDEAQRRMGEIQADTEGLWEERRRLLDGVRGLAGGLVELADAAAARPPRFEPAQPEGETMRGDGGDPTGPPTAELDQPDATPVVVGAPQVGSDENNDDGPPPVSPER